MRQNETNTLFAKKIVGSMVLALVMGAMGSLQAFAAKQPAQQCSLAIVTKQPVGSAQICDAKTVRNLAKQGRVFEQNQLGMVSMLAIGQGYDPAEALMWFQRAAQSAYAPAEVNLAVMYINGWGVGQNYGIALHWLHRAADQGDGRAYYNLGILYLQGNGVPKDAAEAVKYFQKGAEAGDSSAETNLGYMFDQGWEWDAIWTRLCAGIARQPRPATLSRRTISRTCICEEKGFRKMMRRHFSYSSKRPPKGKRGRASSWDTCTRPGAELRGTSRPLTHGPQRPSLQETGGDAICCGPWRGNSHRRKSQKLPSAPRS